jgi:hypothetical protein
LLNILVKEGFARSASTKERRCLKPFHKAKGESVEELSQAQGVHLRCCKFILQAQEGERETARRARRSPLKDTRNWEPWRFSSRAKSQKEVCAELCKECRRSFENNLSLERGICTKCAKESRTCQSPEDEKSSIVEEKTGGRRSRGLGEGTS